MKDVLVYLRETIFRVIDALLFLSLQRTVSHTVVPHYRRFGTHVIAAGR